MFSDSSFAANPFSTAGLSQLVFVTGVQGSGQVGTVSIKVADYIIPVGVSGTGAVGTVFIRGWTMINDQQTPNWTNIETNL